MFVIVIYVVVIFVLVKSIFLFILFYKIGSDWAID